MILCNFSNTDYSLNWYGGKWDNLKSYLNKNNIDGIELLLHGNYDIKDIPKDLVRGLHLSYYPTWLDFYSGNFSEDYPTKEEQIKAYGGETKEAIINRYKEEFEIAKKLKVKYVVFHVSHVTIKDAFHFTYNYSNLDVINAVIDLINQVFVDDSDVTLLFENLWWPGLTLLSKCELDYLMENIRYKNKGVMLDLSHLLITNTEISNTTEGTNYIIDCISNLEDSKKYIKGIHINSTFAKDYLSMCHKQKYEKYINEKEKYEKFKIIYEHIGKLDSHKPYACKSINDIINVVNPDYKIIEVLGHDKDIWESFIEEQLRYLEV